MQSFNEEELKSAKQEGGNKEELKSAKQEGGNESGRGRQVKCTGPALAAHTYTMNDVMRRSPGSVRGGEVSWT